MAVTTRRSTAVTALISVALLLAACQGSSPQAGTRSAPVTVLPQRIVPAPRSLLAATEPQANGIMWGLAGPSTAGLFQFDSSSGQLAGSVSVSRAARSVAESSAGVIGLALGTRHSGALELLDGRTAKVVQTIPLPAPARQVMVGSDGTTFYVLTGWATSASVTIVNSQNAVVHGTVPVPADTVSVAPNVQQASLYALERSGLVDEISISSGQVTGKFKVGGQGRSIVMSPSGATLYVLKGTGKIFNVAVLDAATESLRRVLPAPSDCLELLVSATGSQLYEVVGAAGYGNIQVFAV
jgi:DNA-binding beta-propeller fold protein YncE